MQRNGVFNPKDARCTSEGSANLVSRLLLAVSTNTPVVWYSVVGGLRNGSRQYCQLLLAVILQNCRRWQLLCCLFRRREMWGQQYWRRQQLYQWYVALVVRRRANNTARLLLVIAALPVAENYSAVFGGFRSEILARLLLAASNSASVVPHPP
jgi:hypothetical protein